MLHIQSHLTGAGIRTAPVEVREATLGLALFFVPVTCGNGLPGAVVLSKGYQKPDLEARPGGKIKAEPPWAAG